MPREPDISQLLLALNEGDHGAMDRLVPLVYEHLRKLAHARLRNERAGHIAKILVCLPSKKGNTD